MSGIWFYDYTDDPAYGPKLLAFYPYYLDTASKTHVKIAIPELDVYGLYVVTNAASGITNPAPGGISSANGILYFVLDYPNQDENGLLMVRINADGTLTTETHKDATDPALYPAFSGQALTLRR